MSARYSMRPSARNPAMTREHMTREPPARRRRGRTRGARILHVGDPFALLGLEQAAELTDEDVKAAWRRIAAATHPDRADGGDPEGFALAAAAFTELRTNHGRNNARMHLEHAAHMRRLPARARSWGVGRPVRLAVRVLVASAGATVAVEAAGHGAAGAALATGAVTWLLLTARRDLAALRDLPPGGSGERGRPGSGPNATGLAGSADQADQDPT